MASKTIGKTERKSKKSFTLSVEAVAFLEEMRQKNNAESVSAVLENILQTLRLQERRSLIERQLKDYYDSLTDADVAEEREWGEFALRALDLEDQP